MESFSGADSSTATMGFRSEWTRKWFACSPYWFGTEATAASKNGLLCVISRYDRTFKFGRLDPADAIDIDRLKIAYGGDSTLPEIRDSKLTLDDFLH